MNRQVVTGMSAAPMKSMHFWNEFKSEVAASLSDEQRVEIDRVLSQTSAEANPDISDFRMSFRWFFVRIVWGPEKRSSTRIAEEKEQYPALSKQNTPILASLFAGYAAMVYTLFGLSVMFAVYMLA